MIKFVNTEVSGFKASIRSMRNPMDSWSSPDSICHSDGTFVIGEKDLELAKT